MGNLNRVTTPALEEDVRPSPGGSNTDGLRTPASTRPSDPAPATQDRTPPVGTLVLDPPPRAARPTSDGQPAPDASASPANGAPPADSPAPTLGKSRRRYHEVDLLRFLAAVAVVLYHYLFRASVEDPVFANTGFTDSLGIFRYGNLGVNLFFVISGFVILNSAWKKRPSAFVASRVGRLYPAFWVACTVTAIVILLDPGGRFGVTPEKYLYNLTMAPGLFDVSLIDGAYWTLLVELKFYLLVLVLCLVGMTLNRVFGFAAGWLAVSVWDVVVEPLPPFLSGLLIPEWAPYFVAGIIFALVAREGWSKRYAAVLVVASGWATYLAVDLAAKQSDSYGAALSPWVVGGIVIGIFVLFALIASHKLQARWMARVAFLGGLTYPLYLLHQYIGFILFDLGHGRMSRWLVLAGVLTIVVGMAWLLHVVVEERCAAPLARWVREKWEPVRTFALSTHPIEPAHTRQWSASNTSAPGSSFARMY